MFTGLSFADTAGARTISPLANVTTIVGLRTLKDPRWSTS